MLPFTVEQFFSVFRAYNNGLWPAIPFAYVLGGVIVWAIVVKRDQSARLAFLALALLWLWTGLAYHISYFSAINPLAPVFGGAFIAEAILLAAVGAWMRPVTFASGGYRAIAGWSLIAYVVVAYPLIGLWSGHALAELPQFGVTPCPLTLFTFGVLLLAKPPLPWVLLVIPVLWSLVGGSAAFLLRVPQDWMLLASGIATALMLAATRHSTSPS